MRYCVLLLFFLFTAGVQADSLELIELQHRPAEELLPLLQPLVAGQGTLTGQGFTLILRSDDNTRNSIKALVQQLDQAPRNLLISVRQLNRQQTEQQRQTAGITLQKDQSQLQLGSPTAGNSAQLTLQQHRTRDRDHADYQVRTLDGRSAWIETGSQHPQYYQQRRQTNGQIIIEQQLGTPNTRSGFYVTPRLRGKQVLLDIAPQQQHPGQSAGVINSQGLQTSVLVPLGEWVELGGVSQTANQTQRGLLHHQQTSQRDEHSIEVKVELVE